MDNNLFLRERLGLLQGSGEGATEDRSDLQLSTTELFAFARFLGVRQLVDDFRWAQRGEELILRAELDRVYPPRWFAALSTLWPRLRWKQATWIGLKMDGTVSIHVTTYGVQHAHEAAGQQSRDIEARQRRVTSAVETAWRSFRAGDMVRAERAIGQVPDEEIFIEPNPSQLTWQGALKAVAVGIIIFPVLVALGVALETIIQALHH